MARTYTLKRRAEGQADTRRRIVEAAIDLHGTVGPARTTVSMIAERAGVQRHTLYAHFPDERAMLLACSGHSLALDPLPDGEPWRAIADPAARLHAALPAIYAWFERNEGIVACVLRDAEASEAVREIADLRFAPGIAAWRRILGAGLDARRKAMLTLALSFHAWRTLAREAGLSVKAAAKAMARAVLD